MNVVEWTIIGGLGLLVVGCIVYVTFRLFGEPRTGLNPKSQRLARLLLYPRFFDPLLAKPMSAREKIGWAIVVALMVGAIALT